MIRSVRLQFEKYGNKWESGDLNPGFPLLSQSYKTLVNTMKFDTFTFEQHIFHWAHRNIWNLTHGRSGFIEGFEKSDILFFG